MLTIDTNVVVRIVMNDDPAAADRARRLVAENPVRLGVTVLLESAWVLSRRYGLPRDTVVDALRRFVGLPTVTLESPGEVHLAFEWARTGFEPADALHLALAQQHGAFATFDRRLLRRARALDLPVVEP